MSASIMVWAAQSFAGGVIGKGGGLAFGAVLEAIGVQVSQEAKILERLDEINKKLDQVLAGITDIKAMIKDLGQKLNIMDLELRLEVTSKALTDAKAAIATHYSGIINMNHRRRGGEVITEQKIKTFADNILGIWDIPKHVTAISQSLLEDPNGNHPSGLLQGWTELFIERMGNKKRNSNLYDYYLSLESRFMSYLAIQLQGLFLVVTAKGYGTESDKLPAEAESYLYDEYFTTMLLPQVEHFRWCANKLAMSQGEFRSPAPIQELAELPPGFQQVLLRADLICIMIREALRDRRDTPSPDPFGQARGVHAHVICHTSALVGGAGPGLRPWGSNDYRGRALPRFGISSPEWLPADGNYAVLAEPGQSQLNVVRYMWPFSSIASPRNMTFHDGKPWQEYLNYYEMPALNLIGREPKGQYDFPAAHALNIADILSPVPFKNPQAADAAWSYDNVQGVDEFTTVTKKIQGDIGQPVRHILRPPTPYFRLHAEMEVERGQRNIRNGHTTLWRIQGPVFQYSGKDEKDIKLHLWLSMSTSRRLYMPRSYMNSRLKVILKTPYEERELFDSHSVDNGRLNLWNWYQDREKINPILDATKTEYAQYRDSFTLRIGKKQGQLEKYDIIFDLEVKHEGTPSWTHKTTAGVEFHIKEFSFSWA